jgi:predicted HTH domain antitoxin
MSLHITLKLPPEIEEMVRREAGDLDLQVTEAFAGELFRRGKLTHGQLSRVLGIDRFETDAWLKQRGIYEGSLRMEDLEADRETLERVLGKGG